MKYVGIDGCKAGWFYVSLGEDESWVTRSKKHINVNKYAGRLTL